MDFTLNEDQVRAKVVELLNGRNQARFEMWLESGLRTGVLDFDLVLSVTAEEFYNLAPEVQTYWSGSACNCDGKWN